MKLAIVIALLVAPPAFADVIELKTGQRVEGTLKTATPASVTVEVGGQAITFEGDKVRAIYFGAAPVSGGVQSVTPAREAITALRGLESATSARVSYRDYGPRLQDTKIVVDRYVQSRAEPEAQPTIQAAMDFYLLASRAWALQIIRGPSQAQYENVGRDPVISQCQRLSEFVDKISTGLDRGATRRFTKEESAGMVLSSPPALQRVWSCASDKIGGEASEMSLSLTALEAAEAEQLLGK